MINHHCPKVKGSSPGGSGTAIEKMAEKHHINKFFQRSIVGIQKSGPMTLSITKMSIIAIKMITLYTMTLSTLYTIATLNVNNTQHKKNQHNSNQNDNTLHNATQHVVHNWHTKHK